MFGSIIVPLDGSAFGEQALPYGIALSRRTGAALKLVHVHQRHVPAEPLEALPAYQLQHISDAYDAADAEARRVESNQLWEIAERLVSTGVPATAHVLSGRVPVAISSFARETADGVVVMTTHGRSGLRRLWLGSVADAVVRQCETPVLLVRPTTSAPRSPETIDFRRILVPVDGSAFSNSIIGPVTSLVADAAAAVTFFTVAPTPDEPATTLAPVWSVDGELATDVEPSGLPETFRELLPAALAPAAVKRVIHLHPALAILQEAHTGGYDVIAMTTHGRGAAGHFLLGSTADTVLRGAERPILLFRPPGVARTEATSHIDAVVERVVAPQAVLWE